MSNEELSIIEKVKDVLTRNYSTFQIEISILERMNYNVLYFKKHSGFGYNDLFHIFRYWGVNWEFHIKEWSVESNNNISVRVKLFIFKDIKCEDNKHDMKPQRLWGKNTIICNKCGLFDKIPKNNFNDRVNKFMNSPSKGKELLDELKGLEDDLENE